MFEARDYQAPEEVSRWQTLALGVGVIGSLIVLVVALVFPEQREQALRSWLLGFVFWGGIGIGSLGILLLQYLTGGAWGVVIRRFVEAGSRTIPVIALLFIPVFFGVSQVYEWTHLPDDRVIRARGWFMTTTAWQIRTVIYFALWLVMMYLLNSWSAQQDKTDNYEDSARLLGTATRFSGPTMVIFVLVISFAVVDWTMSLDPHWFSTIWGLLYVVGWALSCFCFMVVVMVALMDKPPLNRVLGKRHFHDIGKLMLALVMVWTYFNFSQFLIIWSGNLPEETTWYLVRMEGGWGWVGALLILFHFAFPFVLLLSRDIKRQTQWLAMLAVFILVMRLIDMFYHIAPSPTIGEHAAGFHISWMDIVAPIGIGGIWLWYFFGELKKRPLVPVNDPFLANAIEHGKGH